jgi:hypothetical protein
MISSGSKTISTAAKFFVGALIFATFVPPAAADDGQLREKTAEDMQNYRFKTVTTPEGLHFTIPEDMPIETRNGLKGPVPYDEYQYYKMRKLEEKMIEVDKKLDRLEANLIKSLAAIERQLDAQVRLSQASQEKPVETPPQP